MSQSAYIIDAVRTPRSAGKPGKGSLCNIHPQHLLGTTLSALRDRNRLNTAEVDDVIAVAAHRLPAKAWISPEWQHWMPVGILMRRV